jgi:hypothetical protein
VVVKYWSDLVIVVVKYWLDLVIADFVLPA